MENLQFVAVANHSGNIKKGMRKLLILIALCIVLMIVSKMFYEGRVHEAIVYKKGMRLHAEVGWPATLFSIGSWGLAAFPVFIIYLYFKQDLKRPAFGITNDGLFINQQLLRKAFVPWDNIAKVELRGHVSNPTIRVFFKDVDTLLKGQFFLFKSIAKATLKSNPSMGISKDEAVGDLISMFDFIKEKDVNVDDRMAGRVKI